LEHKVAKVFFAQVWQQAEQANLTSDEHFTVDGTLLEAGASMKSFQRKGEARHDDPDDPGNPTVNFHGEERSNDSHESDTDPDAQLARKCGGKEAKLSYCGNLLIENGNGLIANTELLQANGTAERDAALLMIEQIPAGKRITVGADKGYDTRGFVAECRQLNATPHVSQNTKRPGGSAIDARTTRHAGYTLSQQKRKRVEECFGWLKTIALLIPAHFEDYKSWRATEHHVKDITIRHDLHALSVFFRKFAVKRGFAAQNPIKEVTKPSDADAIRMHIITEEEALYFAEAARNQNLCDLARIMLLQGCRPEEVLCMRPDDVDFHRAGRSQKKTKRHLHEILDTTDSSFGSIVAVAAGGLPSGIDRQKSV
jgi:hypothetical protein